MGFFVVSPHFEILNHFFLCLSFMRDSQEDKFSNKHNIGIDFGYTLGIDVILSNDYSHF